MCLLKIGWQFLEQKPKTQNQLQGKNQLLSSSSHRLFDRIHGSNRWPACVWITKDSILNAAKATTQILGTDQNETKQKDFKFWNLQVELKIVFSSSYTSFQQDCEQ